MFTFQISQKNDPEEIAESNELNIVSYPFRFYRFSYIDAKKNNNWVEINEHVINFQNVTLRPFDKSGFLYIYYEKKIIREDTDYDYGAEYWINSISPDNTYYNSGMSYSKIYSTSGDTLNKNDWDISNYATYINFYEGEVIWVAYSPVRWSKSFRERIMTDFNAVKERFQKVDITEYTERAKKIENPIKSDRLTNHYAIWDKDQNSPNYNITYAYTKENGFIEYICIVQVATLFVDDMCKIINQKNEDYKEYIDKLVVGIEPETNNAYSEPETYRNLFMSASSLYPILLDYPKDKVSKGKDHPMDLIQKEKFEILLDLENRTMKKDEILESQRNVLYLIFLSKWFRNSLLEFVDSYPSNVQDGKNLLISFYNILKEDPYATDMHIFSEVVHGNHYNPSKDNETIQLTTQHYFFSDENEEKKYKNIDPSTLTYKDLASNCDVIKLLLNTIIDEKDLYPDLDPYADINDLYNAVGEWYDNNEAEDVFNQIASSFVAPATLVKTIVSVDSILWYFTNFVTTSAHYRQLENNWTAFHSLFNEKTYLKEVKSHELDVELEKLKENHDKIIKNHKESLEKANEKYKNDVSKDAKKKKVGKTNRATNKSNNKIEKSRQDIETAKTGLEAAEETKTSALKKEMGDRKIALQRYIDDIEDIKINRGESHILKVRYENQKFATTRKIADSFLWTRLIVSFSFAGLASSLYIYKTDTNNNDGRIGANVLNIVSSSAQLVAVAASIFIDRYDNRWEKVAKIFHFKSDSIMRLGTRVAIVSTIFQIVADGIYAYGSFQKGNNKAGAAYLMSAVSASGAVYMLCAVAVATRAGAAISAPAPWISLTLFGISLLSGMAASYFEYDEFQNFLASCAFSNVNSFIPIFGTNRTIEAQKYKTSYSLGVELFKNRDKYAEEEYTGLGFTNIDLTDYNVMRDVIRTFSVPFRCMLKAKGKEIPSPHSRDWGCIQYTEFNLQLEYYGGMFISEDLECKALLYEFSSDAYSEKELLLEDFAPIELFSNFSVEESIESIDELQTQSLILPSDHFPSTEDSRPAPITDRFNPTRELHFSLPELFLSKGMERYLVVMVRIKSQSSRFVEGVGNDYFPSKRRGEDCYFGHCFSIYKDFFRVAGSRPNNEMCLELRPDTQSNILKLVDFKKNN